MMMAWCGGLRRAEVSFPGDGETGRRCFGGAWQVPLPPVHAAKRQAQERDITVWGTVCTVGMDGGMIT